MPAVKKAPTYEPTTWGPQLPFSEVHDPGCYFSNTTGHMIRIPEDALRPGRSPAIEILAREEMAVTKLSDDPFLPISQARMIAADRDLAVNF